MLGWLWLLGLLLVKDASHRWIKICSIMYKLMIFCRINLVVLKALMRRREHIGFNCDAKNWSCSGYAMFFIYDANKRNTPCFPKRHPNTLQRRLSINNPRHLISSIGTSDYLSVHFPSHNSHSPSHIHMYIHLLRQTSIPSLGTRRRKSGFHLLVSTFTSEQK